MAATQCSCPEESRAAGRWAAIPSVLLRARQNNLAAEAAGKATYQKYILTKNTYYKKNIYIYTYQTSHLPINLISLNADHVFFKTPLIKPK